MTMLAGRPGRPTLHADAPKGPWGGDAGTSSGAGGGAGEGGGGPRNPWAVPPKGTKPSALDELLKRARPGGGGPLLPQTPNPRALWGIGAGILVAIWIAGTAIHPIGPQQRGVVTTFGRYAGTLDPGIQLTLPAPISTVTRVDVQNIRSNDLPVDGGERAMLTRDKNLVDLAYSVRWNIADPEDYVFQIKDPEQTVIAVAESAMREEVANATLDQAMTGGRTLIETRVQERMQRLLDGYHSGVRIQGIAIKQADPPAAVNEAFKEVTAAQGKAMSMQNQARAYAQSRIARAQGEAAAFDAYYTQYRLAPEVTRRRMYYETMEAVLQGTDKTIVETPGVAPLLPLGGSPRKLPDPAADTAPPASGGGQ